MTFELSKTVYDTLKSGGMIPLRACSMCGVNIGYVYRDETIMFDSGCGCSDYSNLRPADEDDIEFLASVGKDEL